MAGNVVKHTSTPVDDDVLDKTDYLSESAHEMESGAIGDGVYVDADKKLHRLPASDTGKVFTTKGAGLAPTWEYPEIAKDPTPQLSADLDALGHKVTGIRLVSFDTFTLKTISAGVITVDHTCHVLAPESGDFDELTTLSEGETGQLLFLVPASGKRILVKHASNNIYLSGQVDMMLDTPKSGIFLISYGVFGWVDVSRSLELGESDWGIVHDFTNWTDLAGVATFSYMDFRRLFLVYTNDNGSDGFYALIYPALISFDNNVRLDWTYYQSATMPVDCEGWIKLEGGGLTAADMDDKGIGFRIDAGGALKGIVYDTELHVVDLGINITDGQQGNLGIIFRAGDCVEWYRNNTYLGKSTDIPSGLAAGTLALGVFLKSTANASITFGISRWAYKFTWG